MNYSAQTHLFATRLSAARVLAARFLATRTSAASETVAESNHRPMTDHRTQLLQLLARLSFKLGDFTLSSGGRSDYYVDCRTTTLHAEGGRLTGLAILDLLGEKGLTPKAVGGLTLGADPIVSAVAIASANRAHEQPGSHLIHGFLVRKAEKTHGTARRIEGFSEPGEPVLIVDDVCTTGASTITAIEAAKAAGMKVIAAICLVERKEAKGRPAVEAACEGAPFYALFTANDVRAAHIAQSRT